MQFLFSSVVIDLKAMLYKGDNFCDLLFFISCSSNPFLKGPTLKGNNLLPLGSKFFPFIIDPLSEGLIFFDRVVYPESISIPLMILNSFLLNWTPFPEGRQNNFDRVVSPECV